MGEAGDTCRRTAAFKKMGPTIKMSLVVVVVVELNRK
jgi:hypothetical protein